LCRHFSKGGFEIDGAVVVVQRARTVAEQPTRLGDAARTDGTVDDEGIEHDSNSTFGRDDPVPTEGHSRVSRPG
jgi:hypothetical protein